MGILLGLASALSWGSADFLARFASRKIGAFRAVLYLQLLGLLLLTLVMPFLGGWEHLGLSGWQPWVWGVVAGLLNTSSTLALYRSFEIGKMSVVAPVSASYPALTLVLSFLTGERLTLVRLVGLGLTVSGVIVVARGERAAADEKASGNGKSGGERKAGVGWALVSAIGFGVMFWLLGIRVVPLLGAVPSVWIIRLSSFAITVMVLLFMGRSLALPPRSTRHWVAGIGVLDTTAYVFNNFGMQREQTSVVSVLASLYGAVTVALAAAFLREQITRLQWCGLCLIFAGIYMISR